AGADDSRLERTSDAPDRTLIHRQDDWRDDKPESAEVKKAAKLPATAVTTKTAQASRATSTTLPPTVRGFVIAEEMVSSWTEVKKTASPKLWMSPPFTPASKTQMRTEPMTRTTSVSPSAMSRRAASRRWRSSQVNSLIISSRITWAAFPLVR